MGLTLFHYVLKAALRDRLVLSVALLLVMASSLSIFLGGSAITEKDKFVLVFAAGSLRFCGVMGLVLFVVFYVRRAFDSRDVEYLLSRPVSRVNFLSSHILAFAFLALMLCVVIVMAVAAVSPLNISISYLYWGVSLFIEYLIMVSVALFFAMMIPSAAAGAMVTFAFYVLARMIGQIFGMIDKGADLSSVQIFGPLMEGVSLIVPRFDLMTQSGWLIYGFEQGSVGLWFAVVQGLVFMALVFTASLVDLTRRQF